MSVKLQLLGLASDVIEFSIFPATTIDRQQRLFYIRYRLLSPAVDAFRAGAFVEVKRGGGVELLWGGRIVVS